MKTGKEAPIVFEEHEYSVLKKYIMILRPKLAAKSNTVFTTIKKLKNEELSFSGFHKILKNYKTETGKKLGSRAVRGSLITNSRDTEATAKERADRAASMSHTVATAERYYNYRDLNESVANTLESSNISSIGTNSPAMKSTPMKRKNSDMDETFVRLRSKKILKK